MRINTRVFGEIDIEEEKIIHFPGGIIGFPDMTEFALIHNSEKDARCAVRWLQSMQEPEFAMPVMDPLVVSPDYNPMVEDELLKPIGVLNPESILVLVTMTVPKDIKKMTVNLQAPFVINADEKKACQIIVDTEQYPIRFPIYDILEGMKKEGK
ncbi:MAG: flagellar assembly protein FliW [Lachnospiraceae bacterium]|nr:flagellar assembly protein FliW [Lachnospiraceae bacterium]